MVGKRDEADEDIRSSQQSTRDARNGDGDEALARMDERVLGRERRKQVEAVNF
jgi:hypothetical protein